MNHRKLTVAIALALITVASGCAQRQVAQPAKDKERDNDALVDRRQAGEDEKKLLETSQSAPRSEEVPGSRADKPKSLDAGHTKAIAEQAAGDARKAEGALAILAPSAPPPQVRMPALPAPAPPADGRYWEPSNRETYAKHDDNPVFRTVEDPVSTFSIDVDTGAYTNARRMITQGALPPANAVRAEEFINYFDYGYAPPRSLDTPFSVTTELAPAPWNPERKLLLVGIKGYEVPASEIPASNIVFLIDTSGSMNEPNKLPLLRESFKQMVPSLRAQDRVSVVVYAGSAGLILPPTPGDQHERIVEALDALEAGGSTNGGAGIELAYRMAQQGLVKGGVNRVVLATDGDFNVGTVSVDALKSMVADKRKSGVALTTLGFGQGNYNDELAEQLADIGDGNHYYIDNLNEARKVLVDEIGATMLTIAKDVKIQVEFNPAAVSEYRLIGYENRKLKREDFNNDHVDAGEIGAGHDVTALYELTLAGSAAPQVDPLRYGGKPVLEYKGEELAFLRLRYKAPGQDTSKLIERPVKRGEMARAPSERLAFAASVAAFADTLRGGTHLGKFGLAQVADLAQRNRGGDEFGYRAEFVELVRKAQSLQTPSATAQLSVSE